MAAVDNTLYLLVNNQQLTGWTASRVTVSLDKTPRDFAIELTDRNPLNSAILDVKPGQSCQVKIGPDYVISGWIDRVNPSFSPKAHGIRILGRSKCQDLVDCSVTPDILVGMQIITNSIVELATKLCKPFGITVAVGPGVDPALTAPGGAPMQFNAVLTETPWEILERVARYKGLLIYDTADGNLMIANVGTSTMASGFAEGVNVQAAAVTYSMDERYSKYWPALMSTNVLGQQGVGGMTLKPALDAGVTRFRPLIIVSEQFQYGQPLAEKRAQWEAARRFGRSQAVVLTADNWRDSKNTLWVQNAFAPITLPTLKLTPSDPWIIGNVSFVKDADRGTVVDVMLMPKEAFQPEPTILQGFLYDPTAKPAQGGAAAAVPGESNPTGGAPT